ncbi:carbohydrate ABC transporter permease [Pseudonocardia parietis]|uniref:Multiple sugar transport system permease protein n=1 Tax=Pseudonocardia parietis TaxID=570936 RepID=A0ABS4W6T2_9PSEU|nr:sugar ABC transporter permease [Pseudonocardia parietis]MBP2371823.1 multiple sugar transport system permease protein [Pseudonocardia parietis]
MTTVLETAPGGPGGNGPARFVEVAAPPRLDAPAAVRVPPAKRIARAVPPYLFLLPGLALLVIWIYRPLVTTVQLSFFSWNLLPTSPAEFVGFANYERLFDLPDFPDALGRTAVLILGLLPFTLVVPTIVGLLARQVHGRAATVYQALVFAPMLVAPVAGAAVWQWMLDPRGGLVNQLLGTTTNWLQEPGPAQIAIIVITGWHVLGFATLVVAAGLAGIDSEYSAAASLDGATRWQTTRWITLPLLSPTLSFLLLMTLLLAAQWSFPLVNTLTHGGPSGATTNVYYLLWDYAFGSFDAGLGAAAGMIFFLGFGLIALLLVRLTERLTFHDS